MPQTMQWYWAATDTWEIYIVYFLPAMTFDKFQVYIANILESLSNYLKCLRSKKISWSVYCTSNVIQILKGIDVGGCSKSIEFSLYTDFDENRSINGVLQGSEKIFPKQILEAEIWLFELSPFIVFDVNFE